MNKIKEQCKNYKYEKYLKKVHNLIWLRGKKCLFNLIFKIIKDLNMKHH